MLPLDVARSWPSTCTDDNANPIMNTYVRKVERVTDKAEDFLKNPVYSRDYPPCQAC